MSGLTEDERERFENTLRWHFDVVAEEGKRSSYITAGVLTAVNQVEAILRDRAGRTAPAPDPAAGDTDAGAAVERVRALCEDYETVARHTQAWTRYLYVASDIRQALAGTEETR